MPKITPFLWFDHQAEDAARFYTSIFKNSKIGRILRYSEGVAKATGQPAGSVLTIEFEIEGHSFVVNCDSQEEVDYFWEKLTADGGEESACGWITDKFGLSWQVVPAVLIDMLHDEDSEKSERVTNAMLQMKKIDIKTLKEVYEQ